MFAATRSTAAERAEARPGDALVVPAAVVMDRAFDVPAPPEQVWPWLVQLGRRRAGWYLPRAVERFVPPGRRALRTLDPRWQSLAVGVTIPDWGGRDASFTVDEIEAPATLVHRSQRGALRLSWSLVLRPGGTQDGAGGAGGTRVLLRLRMGPVRRVRLARTVGGFVDAATIAGLAAGLRERVGGARGSSRGR